MRRHRRSEPAGLRAPASTIFWLQPKKSNPQFRLPQYVDLGTANLASSTTNGTDLITQSVSAHAAFSVVTVGFNWRFYPATSMPWRRERISAAMAALRVALQHGRHLFQSPAAQAAASDVRLKRDIALVGRRDDYGLGLYRYAIPVGATRSMSA